jgi:Subtilase family
MHGAGDVNDHTEPTGQEDDLQHGLPSGIKRAPHELGGGYLYVPGELLVAPGDLARVRHHLEALSVSVSEEMPVPNDIPLYRLRFAEDPDAPQAQTVPYVVAKLLAVHDHHHLDHDQDLPAPRVAPNHVAWATYHPKPFGPTHLIAGNVPYSYAYSGDEPVQAERESSALQAESAAGEPAVVAVLDGGYYRDHRSFGERRIELRDEDDEQPRFDTGEPRRLAPYSGHGTFVAGIVFQQAPAAILVARKVYTHGWFVNDIDLAVATAALHKEVNVILYPLGAFTHAGTGLLATAAALQQRFELNPRLAVVAAAGNEGSQQPVFPAAYKRVVAVAALDATGKDAACFSGRGEWVSASAPGSDVRSDFFTLDALPPRPVPGDCLGVAPVEEPLRFDGSAVWSGTSFAAAYVAGRIAASIADDRDASRAAYNLVGAAERTRLPNLGTVVT